MVLNFTGILSKIEIYTVNGAYTGPISVDTTQSDFVCIISVKSKMWTQICMYTISKFTKSYFDRKNVLLNMESKLFRRRNLKHYTN